MNDGSKDFERQYFEDHSSYGESGGYSQMLPQARAFYAEYFRLASGAIPGFYAGKGKKALEVGCAFGAGSLLLHEYGYEVTATDVSAYACERARELLPQDVTVRRMDVREDGKDLGLFDLVASIQVVEHVEGTALIDAICARIAPGGYAVIATPNPASISPYRRFQADPTHINEQPPAYWTSSLRSNGLTIRKCATYHIAPIVHRWIGVRLLPVPQFLGYDCLIVAQRT